MQTRKKPSPDWFQTFRSSTSVQHDKPQTLAGHQTGLHMRPHTSRARLSRSAVSAPPTAPHGPRAAAHGRPGRGGDCCLLQSKQACRSHFPTQKWDRKQERMISFDRYYVPNSKPGHMHCAWCSAVVSAQTTQAILAAGAFGWQGTAQDRTGSFCLATLPSPRLPSRPASSLNPGNH